MRLHNVFPNQLWSAENRGVTQTVEDSMAFEHPLSKKGPIAAKASRT